MRLIDADVLIEKIGIGKDCAECQHNEEPFCRWKPDVVDVCEAICTAPTIKPEPHWIPCSERLPKEEIQDYWVCLENGYQQQCRWMRYGHFYEWHTVAKVVAWMPLPEPYQGEGEQE